MILVKIGNWKQTGKMLPEKDLGVMGCLSPTSSSMECWAEYLTSLASPLVGTVVFTGGFPKFLNTYPFPMHFLPNRHVSFCKYFFGKSNILFGYCHGIQILICLRVIK